MDAFVEALDSTIALLDSAGEGSWVRALRHAREVYIAAPSNGRVMVKGMFGGMGSLNDLVLHDEGRVLFRENEALDALRSELFALAVSHEG